MLASGGKILRKRKQGNTSAFLDPSGFLVNDIGELNYAANNVVESSKVKQYLERIDTEDLNNLLACVKLIICDSEADVLNSDVQKLLRNDFNVESIYVSESVPHTVDRIVTLHGNLNCISRCALYISFMMCSRENNILNVEPYTLKSQNYQLSVLIEADVSLIRRMFDNSKFSSIDICQYERNTGLQQVNLKGDFIYLFKTLCSIFERFSYSKYASDDDIKSLHIINVYDGESLQTRTEEHTQNCVDMNANLLGLILQPSHLVSTINSRSSLGT